MIRSSALLFINGDCGSDSDLRRLLIESAQFAQFSPGARSVRSLIRLLPSQTLSNMAVPCFLPSVPVITSNRHPLNRSLLTLEKPIHHAAPHYPGCHILKATSDLVPQPPLQNTDLPRLQRILHALYPFSRPHTIHGTLVSVLSLTLLSPLLTGTTFRTALLTLRSSLPPALLANIYIVGLNQLHDIPLDRVNKPNLPLPSGNLTPIEARIIIYTALVLSLLSIALASTAPLVIVVAGSIILGTAYSAPPLRLKRFAALASAAIMCVRGVLINSCFFLHASRSTALPFLVRFALVFFTLFGTVIALLKDVPDIPGDRMFGIRTFCVRVGGDVVFNVCVTILVSLFICGAGVYSVAAWGKVVAGGMGLAKGAVTAIGAVIHLIIAKWLWKTAADVQVYERSSVTKYYMNSWKVFYLEYLLLPLAAL